LLDAAGNRSHTKTMSIYTVFYSWQSDLPNATNRGLIQQALERAAKSVRDDESIQVEPVVDRDTIGVPGSPDIAETIFAKIERSRVFVCDVSILNQEAERPTPNPNVLIELGYTRKVLGVSNIIMVMNTAFGGPELLPFDLRPRRVITYCMPKETEERAPERRKLEATLKEGLRTILGGTVGESLKAPSRKISLQAWNGQYIRAEGGGGGKVLANRGEIDEWATFDLSELENNKIGLRAHNGDFVCAEGGGGREIVASRKMLSAWETFELVKQRDDRVALRVDIGQYVSVEDDADGVVVAIRNSPHKRTTFRLIQHSETEKE
jgi:hypothetical protein